MKRKRFAIFGCGYTSRYRHSLCRAFNTAADELGVDLVYFNSMGMIGEINAQYGDYEFDLIEDVDLAGFDGIIYDGEGYNVEGMADKVIRKLRRAGCPVVSVSNCVDGFFNIEFDDAGALADLTDHFIKAHGFTRIGYMSGPLAHPDARARLEAFRSVMKKNGMPENGAGMFEGDFWFHKGEEAADFFLSQPLRPQAVVCANDYMAIALATALKNRGIKIPDDIAVSGFDGTIEGQEYLPHITSATRERLDIARKALRILANDGKEESGQENVRIRPRPIYTQSCGCSRLDYRYEAESVNRLYEINRKFSYALYDTESSLLLLNKVENLHDLEELIKDNPIDFGAYRAFFLMLLTDEENRLSIENDFTHSTGKFSPIIWIDRNREYSRSERTFDTSNMIPESDRDKSHFYYVMSVHCAERLFGYAAIEMEGKDIFDEFYNIWLLNIALTLEGLLKNDRINRLIGRLQDMGIRDSMTGMLNRRGFDTRAREALSRLRDKQTVCAMVIDMDGLKRINDEYGHYEGDSAIKAAADMITKCCDSGEIAARAGGDEFYIFSADYSDRLLERFNRQLSEAIEAYNKVSGKPYKVSLSCGAYLAETDSKGRIEDFLSVSDARMYEAKMKKPGKRR
ncbi:MAG: GGDEF domain-containing protein [Lachnospiraceae bacterium]|nr:GGDEF domain-containing protein [Lachnospiraceae bacterium]